jgi:hypothetical protein
MSELHHVLDRRSLSVLRTAIERSPLIVELRLTQSPHEPERLVFNRFERLVDFLDRVARPGDQVRAWAFDDVCRADGALVDLALRSVLGRR